MQADYGGTRHRAAYYLYLAAPECLAMVACRDGSVLFVPQQEGKVICWVISPSSRP